MFFLLIIVVMPALGLMWWLWADRRLKRLKHPRRWRIAVAAFEALMLGGFLWVILARRFGVTTMPPAVVLAAVYIWHLIVLPSWAVTWLVIGLPMVGGKLLRRSKPADPQQPPQASAVDHQVTRREILGAVAASLPPLVTIGAVGAALPQLDEFRVREIDVPVSGLPPDLSGMTIAHVSDVHVGKYTRGKVLEQIVERTNALKADLVLLTGDLIDWSMKDLPAALEMVKALRSRDGGGAIMCEGNHDLFDDRLGFEHGVKDAGVALLLNESQMLTVRGRPVQILGIKWGGLSADRRYSGISEHVDAVSWLRRPEAFPILLAHHPHALDAAAARDFPLTLAGHTHGGQLMAAREVGAGPMLFKYWSGLYQRGNSSLVVSNGVGNWFPLRINAPAEILHLKLVRWS
jgi:uncharacterized protein